MKTIAQQLNVKDFPFIIKDDNGKRTYYEDSTGYWIKREYDKEGNEIYYENSDGIIEDNRSTELTLNEIADKLRMDVKNLKIKE